MNNTSRRIRQIQMWSAILATLLGISVVAAKTGLLIGEKANIVIPMMVRSPSFKQEGAIPARYTCDDQNVSPPLEWAGVPTDTKSLALIVDDPGTQNSDAPRMAWVHWVIYNIPSDSHGMPESAVAEPIQPGTLLGLNDWHHTGYEGPCPTTGKSSYFFKLYALDTLLPDLKRPTKAALETAMHGHILGQSTLVGFYPQP